MSGYSSTHIFDMEEKIYVTQAHPIGRSENKNMMQFLPFANEVRPGVAIIFQDFLFTDAKILVLIKKNGQILLPYSQLRNGLAVNRKKG